MLPWVIPRDNFSFLSFYTYSSCIVHDFILTNHRAYTLSQTEKKSFLQRKNRRSLMSTNPKKDSVPEPKLYLDSLYVDDHFTAVSGVFPDEKFVEYLYRQPHVDYVEANQLYKAQIVHPLQDYPSSNDAHTYNQRRDELERSKKRGLLQNAVSPNWGQARITQRERGDMGSYSFDKAAG